MFFTNNANFVLFVMFLLLLIKIDSVFLQSSFQADPCGIFGAPGRGTLDVQRAI